jgi:YHS domain-containing protein
MKHRFWQTRTTVLTLALLSLSWWVATNCCEARDGQVPPQFRQGYPPPGPCPPCDPNWRHYGHYEPVWRHWPGPIPVEQTDNSRAVGKERIPAPAGREELPPPKAEPSRQPLPQQPPQQLPSLQGEGQPRPPEPGQIAPPGGLLVPQNPAEGPSGPPGPAAPSTPAPGGIVPPGGLLVPQNPAEGPSGPAAPSTPAPGGIVPPGGLLVPQNPEKPLGPPGPAAPSTRAPEGGLPGLPGLPSEPPPSTPPGKPSPDAKGPAAPAPKEGTQPPANSKPEATPSTPAPAAPKDDKKPVAEFVPEETPERTPLIRPRFAQLAADENRPSSTAAAVARRDVGEALYPLIGHIEPEPVGRSTDAHRADSIEVAAPALSPERIQRMSYTVESPAVAVAASAARPRVAMEGYCPVELGREGRWTPGDVRWTAVYKGWTYRFSGARQRQQFLADPESFAPVNSCNDPVLSVDQNRAVAGQVAHCAVYDGRLYMFSSAATQERFNRNPQRYATMK